MVFAGALLWASMGTNQYINLCLWVAPFVAVRGFRVRVLKYNSTLPAAHRGTSSRIVGLHSGLFVVSYNRNARGRCQETRLDFSQLGRVFVSRLRNSRYFNLVKLVSAFNLLKHATALRVRTFPRLRRLLHPRLSCFYRNVPCSIRFRPFPRNYASVVCRSHSMDMRTFPLDRHVPYYNFIFRRGPATTRVGHRVVSFCRVPFDVVGHVGGNRSCIAPSKRIVPGDQLALPTTPPHGCICYDSAHFGPGGIGCVGKTSLLFRRTAFTRDRTTHTTRAFRDATHRTTRVTHLDKIGRLLIKRFSTQCASRQILLSRTHRVFTRARLSTRKYIFDV